MVITDIFVLHHSHHWRDNLWHQLFKYDLYSPWIETEAKCQKYANEYGRPVRVIYSDMSERTFLPEEK